MQYLHLFGMSTCCMGTFLTALCRQNKCCMLAQNTLSTPGLCTAGNVAYALLAWAPAGSACLPARMSQMQGFQTLSSSYCPSGTPSAELQISHCFVSWVPDSSIILLLQAIPQYWVCCFLDLLLRSYQFLTVAGLSSGLGGYSGSQSQPLHPEREPLAVPPRCAGGPVACSFRSGTHG